MPRAAHLQAHAVVQHLVPVMSAGPRSMALKASIGLLALSLGLIALWLPPPAAADPQSRSWSRWQFDAEGARVVVSAPLREVTRLATTGAPAEALAAHVAPRLSLHRADRPCRADTPRTHPSAPERVQVSLRFHCPTTEGAHRVGVALFLDYAASHIHFARFSHSNGIGDSRRLDGAPGTEDFNGASGTGDVGSAYGTGEFNGASGTGGFNSAYGTRPSKGASGSVGFNSAYGTGEILFNRHQVEATLHGSSLQEGRSGRLWPSYLRLGVEHIVVGVDHVAFLLALVLVQRRGRELAASVTGFTLGHSLTLGIAVLGLAQPLPHRIEAGIGFTVALVALEFFRQQGIGAGRLAAGAGATLLALAALALAAGTEATLWYLGLALIAVSYLLAHTRGLGQRVLLAALFGTVHGFGFAGVLTEVGWPAQRWPEALVAFNLGVELGQLLWVAAMLLMLAVYRRLLTQRSRRVAAETTAAALLALGIFWLLSASPAQTVTTVVG